MPMACVSGDEGARMEDIKASSCSASSLSQCIKQNACQLHITVTARCTACDMPRAVVRWERRENEHHETSPITARVIGGRCVHNPSFQGVKMGVDLNLIMPFMT